MEINQLLSEVKYQFARSGGKGGQNVNKVESKAELYFDIPNSAFLTEEQKATLLTKLSGKVTTEGILILYHQTERSQLANRDKVTQKFVKLIQKSFEKMKARKATKPSAAAREERRADKKRRADIKKLRRRIEDGLV